MDFELHVNMWAMVDWCKEKDMYNISDVNGKLVPGLNTTARALTCPSHLWSLRASSQRLSCPCLTWYRRWMAKWRGGLFRCPDSLEITLSEKTEARWERCGVAISFVRLPYKTIRCNIHNQPIPRADGRGCIWQAATGTVRGQEVIRDRIVKICPDEA